MDQGQDVEQGILDCNVTMVGVAKGSKDSIPTTKASSQEDAFEGLYWGGHGDRVALEPPCNIGRLEKLVEETNTLQPCIDAYAVNVSGTGLTLLKEGVEVSREDDDQGFYDFFGKVNLSESLVTLRKKLTRSVEGSGNGYLEFVHSRDGSLMFLNVIPSRDMRLVRLGEPVSIDVSIRRGGMDLKTSVTIRPRAYVQKVDNTFVYFREVGVPLHIDAETGEWGTAEEIPYDRRGTAIQHYTALETTDTPYGLPRWFSQVPSVIGSRKAEELNVGFFNSGGIPPAIVFVSGGRFKEGVAKQLENIFNAVPSTVGGRAAVVEVQSGGGSIDRDTVPKIDVERFEEVGDSRWEKYDERCERRVRASFRLPPLFVGKTDDYNYASAYTSFLTAEAQVFAPERFEFDEKFNNSVMQELDPSGSYTIRSKAVSFANVENQLKALGIAVTMPGVQKSPLSEVLEGILGVELDYEESKEVDVNALLKQLGREEKVSEVAAAKGDSSTWATSLASTYIKTLGLDPLEEALSGSIDADVLEVVKGFDEAVATEFFSEVSRQLFDTPGLHGTLRHLCACGGL